MGNMAEQENAMQKVITKCREDEVFRARLLADPTATLEAEGVDIPEGMTVSVAVDSGEVPTLVVLPAPATARMVDEDLTDIAVAGSSGGSDQTNMMMLQQLMNNVNAVMDDPSDLGRISNPYSAAETLRRMGR